MRKKPGKGEPKMFHQSDYKGEVAFNGDEGESVWTPPIHEEGTPNTVC
jgi:hypothetical protein